MPRKAKLAPEAEIRKLKAEVKELKEDYDDEAERRIKAEDERRELRHHLAQLTPPLSEIRDVDFGAGKVPDDVNAELTDLYNLLLLLDAMTPARRHRLLAMIDARFYDPPVKAAK